MGHAAQPQETTHISSDMGIVILKLYRISAGWPARIPLLPRYALGNWWSRFYRYTQDGHLS